MLRIKIAINMVRRVQFEVYFLSVVVWCVTVSCVMPELLVPEIKRKKRRKKRKKERKKEIVGHLRGKGSEEKYDSKGKAYIDIAVIKQSLLENQNLTKQSNKLKTHGQNQLDVSLSETQESPIIWPALDG